MKNEATIQAEIRLNFSEFGGTTWRNNSGVLPSQNGRPVRFGLGNESKKLNEVIKSSDLIGITPVLIQPHHVGKTIGIFTAIETKPEGWIYRPGDPRSIAQLAFIEHVNNNGGIAGFCNNPAVFMHYLKECIK